MEATGFPTSADIYLELDGRKIAVVQGYTARASKSSQSVEAVSYTHLTLPTKA